MDYVRDFSRYKKPLRVKQLRLPASLETPSDSKHMQLSGKTLWSFRTGIDDRSGNVFANARNSLFCLNDTEP
jgi:hypothetical protein